MLTRALYRVVALPHAPVPYDRLLCKLFYPAHDTGTDSERNTGVLPALPREGGYPVVIFFNGMNVEKAGYQWLAEALTAQGCAVVLFDYIAEVFGAVSLTPGIDLDAVRVGEYGTRPTSSTLPALLSALDEWNASAPLNGALNTAQVILGGHSAGGTVALHNANPRWFPAIRGAFTYAGHTLTSTLLGYPAGTILPVPSESAYLLMGGTHDGVISASKARYGEPDPADPITRTFEEGITGGHGDCYYVRLSGASHFACVHPQDATTGRAFLETDPPQLPATDYRPLLARLIATFIEQVCGAGQALTGDDPLIAHFARK